MSRTKKRKVQEKPKSQSKTARSWFLPILVLGIGVCLFSFAIARSRHSRSFEPVLPADVSGFDKTLIAKLHAAAEEVRKSPSNAETHARLGYLYEAHNYRDLARSAYHNATLIDPKDARWWYLWATVEPSFRGTDEALDALKKSLSLNPEYANTYEHLGKQLLDRGDIEEAVRILEQVVRLVPDRPEGYIHLGAALVANEKAGDAIPLLRKAISLPPERKEAWYVLGRAYQSTGMEAESEAAFARAVGADATNLPDLWRLPVDQARSTEGALYRKADSLMAHGHLAEAIEVFEQLSRDNPKNVDYLSNLASSYLGVGRTEDALSILGKALAIRSDYFPLHINMASALMNKGNLEGALVYAEKATQLAPTIGRGHFTRGLVLARLGRKDEALTSLTEAKKLEPQDFNVCAALGEIYIGFSQLDAAIAEFEQAVRLNPDSAIIRYNLAMTYSKASRFAESLQQLEEAAKLEPNNQRIAQSLERIRLSAKGNGQ